METRVKILKLLVVCILCIGIITAVVTQMVDFAFRTYDIDRVYARPFGTNIASQRVLEKAGFVLEARIKDAIYKNGEKDDELIYAVRREE